MGYNKNQHKIISIKFSIQMNKIKNERKGDILFNFPWGKIHII